MTAVGEATDQRESESANPADPPFSFGDVAQRYDGLNHLMSLGQDLRWRKIAAEALDLPDGGRALDVGVGTGDMALALLRRWPGSAIAGVDPTQEMMRVGRHKPGTERIRWTQGNGLRLPFPTAHFDGVTSAFLMRNVGNVPGALAEQYRVLRPGGRLVCLEMTWPRTPVLGPLFQFYFARMMPRITGLLSGQSAAYNYLPRSVQRFMTPEELEAAMERVGLRNVRYRLLMMGTVALHTGERE